MVLYIHNKKTEETLKMLKKFNEIKKEVKNANINATSYIINEIAKVVYSQSKTNPEYVKKVKNIEISKLKNKFFEYHNEIKYSNGYDSNLSSASQKAEDSWMEALPAKRKKVAVELLKITDKDDKFYNLFVKFAN